MVTTNSVMQLHQRLKNNEESSNGTDNRKQEMLKELENAVMMTQSMLTKITTNKYVNCHFPVINGSFFVISNWNLMFLPSFAGQPNVIALVIMSRSPKTSTIIYLRNRTVNTHKWWTNARIFYRKCKSMFKTTTFKPYFQLAPSFCSSQYQLSCYCTCEMKPLTLITETYIFIIVYRKQTIRTKTKQKHTQSRSLKMTKQHIDTS